MKRATRNPALGSLMAIAIVTLATTAAAQSRDERAVRAASDAWQRYVVAQQIDSIVALHTPDAVAMFANAPATMGSAAIRTTWGDFIKTPGLNVHWTPARINILSPTVATEYGTYTESYDTPNGKANDAGNYLTVWNKINGKWRVAYDVPVSTMAAAPAMPADATTFEARSGNALTWNDFAAPGFPPGAKITVLHGNPSAAGRFVLRLNLPDGYQIPLHWHPTAESVTIISGGLNFGMGNAVDANATQSYSAGDFAFIPARHPHWATARGATVLQVGGNGPFVLNLGTPK